jgi:hypothetical protein
MKEGSRGQQEVPWAKFRYLVKILDLGQDIIFILTVMLGLLFNTRETNPFYRISDPALI